MTMNDEDDCNFTASYLHLHKMYFASECERVRCNNDITQTLMSTSQTNRPNRTNQRYGGALLLNNNLYYYVVRNTNIEHTCCNAYSRMHRVVSERVSVDMNRANELSSYIWMGKKQQRQEWQTIDANTLRNIIRKMEMNPRESEKGWMCDREREVRGEVTADIHQTPLILMPDIFTKYFSQ